MIDIQKNMKRFEAEMSAVSRPGAELLMRYIRNSDFYTAPASTRYHLSCEGGLCQHSLNVLDAMRAMLVRDSENMWEYRVAGKCVQMLSDESVVLIALMHDLCKTCFYKTSTRNVKNENGVWEKVPYYTVEDAMPLGHGDKSAMLVMSFMKLTNDEMYAIWWHMGMSDNSASSATLNSAIEKHPVIWLTHTADMMASVLMEDKTGNRPAFDGGSEFAEVPSGLDEPC